MNEPENTTFPFTFRHVVSGLTCLLLSALAVAVLLSGYYSHACSHNGAGWGIFTVAALLMVFPFVTIPVWFAAAFVLAKYLQPATSASRYFTILALTIPAYGIIFVLGLLFAIITGAVAKCSFGF